jgi:hypothetical protein
MAASLFLQNLINEQINLSKNKLKSKFNLTLESILSEDEVVPGTISSPPNASAGGPPATPQANPVTPEPETDLPPINADIEIKLSRLAALALLTDIHRVLDKHEELRSDEIVLSKLKDSGISGKEDCLKALQKILKFVKLGDNEVGFDIDQDFVKKFDPSSEDAITNLILKVLFISKDKILQNNDSLRSVVDDIGSLQSQIKPIEKSDPVAATDLAKQIVQKINNDILPSADLTI